MSELKISRSRDNPLISVIVPVYNVENYLDECVRSIVQQTYSNLEIILVDDGSTDASSAICENWRKKDKRIQVIHKKNGGLSDARNKGLELASGKYISFVDSDDWIGENLYERMLEKLLDEGAQIAGCKICKVYETYIEEQEIHSKQQTFSDKEALLTILKGQDFCAVAWNKLYERDIIGNIRFPYGKIHEDEYFTYKVVARATKLVFVKNAVYYYRQRSGSIMNHWSSKHLDAIDALYERSKFIEKNYLDLYTVDKFNLYMTCVYNGRSLLVYSNEEDMRLAIEKVIYYAKINRFTYSDYLKLGLRKTFFILRGKVLFRKLKRLYNQ